MTTFLFNYLNINQHHLPASLDRAGAGCPHKVRLPPPGRPCKEVVAVTTKQPRQDTGNCLESQQELVRDLVAGWFQEEPYLSMELRIINSLRIQAVRTASAGILSLRAGEANGGHS